MFKVFRSAVCIALCGLGVGSASATLIDRGGGLIYDSDINITWLADANYAKTSGYSTDGRMFWNAATVWAANLVYHDSVRNIDYGDWRLPTALNKDLSGPCGGGYNCTDSEMGHLYYVEMGLVAGQSFLDSSDLDLALFQNVQLPAYWSGTVTVRDYPLYWNFETNSGHQGYAGNPEYSWYAWAVRDGDVLPEPATLALFALGLAGLGFSRRKAAQA